MYYLAKFCRICIQTGVKLVDINTLDFDYVTFSEKLEFCTKMIITKESLSTQICIQCVKKLRVSYDFQSMCKESTKILQGYLTELISGSNKITPDTFVNSELRVTLSPLNKNVFKRKRITKMQRCFLLKKLLTTKKIPKKARPKIHLPQIPVPKISLSVTPTPRRQKPPKLIQKGGLRGILEFTRNYDFGYQIDGNHNNCLLSEASPLARLTNFSNTFFINNFADFKNTILYIIESKDNFSESDDDDDMFDIPEQIEEVSEEVVVEPDIKIKTELFDYDESETNFSCNYYVEASYSDCKKENFDIEDQIVIKQEPVEYKEEAHNSMNSVQLLDKLVGSFSGGNRKAFSPNSVRCRTRGNPYINPKLKQQFLYKSFQCDKCNRYFKSPGYLKAHLAKIHS